MGFSEPRRNIKDTQLQFILAELAVGLTLASSANRQTATGKSRARARARTAFDSALRFIPRVHLTQQESQKVQSKLESLKTCLESLGETF